MLKMAIAVLVFATSVNASDLSRTPTMRPTPADMSYAVFEKYPTEPLKWYRGYTATQVQREAVLSGLMGIAVPRVINYMKRIPGCADDLGFAFSNFSYFTGKLDGEYEAGRMRQGDWFVKVAWPYSIPWYIERRARDCSTTGIANARLCATTSTGDVRNYLNIRVDGTGKCVKGGAVGAAAPKETYDSTRAELGTITTKTLSPIPDSEETTLLILADIAHSVGSPDTDARRRAAEDSADDEAEHHRFRLKDFMSDVDPAWGDAIELIHAKQDESFGCWVDNVLRGDWFAAQMCNTDHQLWHICGSIRDDRLLIRLSCPAGLGRFGNMDRCPMTTCEEAL